MAFLNFAFFVVSIAATHSLPTSQNYTATKFRIPFRYRSHIFNRSQILAQERQLFPILTHSMATVSPIRTEFVASLDIGLDEMTQTVNLIVDPGSPFIWWQCNCNVSGGHCYHQKGENPLYDKDYSDTYRKLYCNDHRCICGLTKCGMDYSNPQGNQSLCRYNARYVDETGSSGIMSTEHLILETELGCLEVDIVFGCGENQTFISDAFTDASGILGLSNHSYSLTNQLNASAFSVCLPSRVSYDSSSIDFHTVWSPPDYERESVITDLIEPPWKNNVGYYYVDIVQVKVGNVKVDVPESLWGFSANGGGGTIVDFGATLTYLPREAFLKLRDLFTTQVNNKNPELIPVEDRNYEGCFEIPPNLDLNSLSITSISFTFRGGVVYDTRKPDQVLFHVNENKTCLAFYPSPVGDNSSILGNILFQRMRTHFALQERLIVFEYDGCNCICWRHVEWWCTTGSATSSNKTSYVKIISSS